MKRPAKTHSAIWYAVHAVQVFERRKAPRFKVFENVYLVKARSPSEAKRQGAAYARVEARQSGSFEMDGQVGCLRFAGIRKVVWCASNPATLQPPEVDEMHNGTEATFLKFSLESKRDLTRFLAGRPVSVVREE